MKVTILPGPASGRITVISSKSHLHRLLILASLADKQTLIHCEHSYAEDIQATITCLEALGAVIDIRNKGFMVTPLNRMRLPPRAVFPCGESGSTLRFMLPLACALGVSGEFSMSGRLPDRPLAPLDRELSRHGIQLSQPSHYTLQSEGKLTAGNYTLPGTISSQYISGLLMALPLLQGSSSLAVEGLLESADYVTMTLQTEKAFGFRPVINHNRYEIPGRASGENFTFSSPEKIAAEGDWSNAAFWLCAGAMPGGKIKLAGLNIHSVQGDRAISDILEHMGAHINWEGETLDICEGRRRGVEIDARAIPDLIPALCAVAAVSAGKTVVKNAGRLRLKESDRLAAVAQTLNSLGAKVKEGRDSLHIQGVEGLCGGEVDAWGDHRIAMMAAVASLACGKPVTIKGAEAVSKSYPAFWETFRSLGKEVLIDE